MFIVASARGQELPLQPNGHVAIKWSVLKEAMTEQAWFGNTADGRRHRSTCNTHAASQVHGTQILRAWVCGICTPIAPPHLEQSQPLAKGRSLSLRRLPCRCRRCRLVGCIRVHLLSALSRSSCCAALAAGCCCGSLRLWGGGCQLVKLGVHLHIVIDSQSQAGHVLQQSVPMANAVRSTCEPRQWSSELSSVQCILCRPHGMGSAACMRVQTATSRERPQAKCPLHHP